MRIERAASLTFVRVNSGGYDVYNRHSIRRRGYDYSRNGAYFVTIVAHARSHRFGRVMRGVMALNDAGHMVHSALADLDVWYPGVHIDVFQVMPDHVHAIIRLSRGESTPPCATTPVGAGPRACPSLRAIEPPSLRAIEPRCERDGSVRAECHRDTRDVSQMDIGATGGRGSCTTGQCATRPRDGACGVSSRGRARGPAPTGVVIADHIGARPLTLGDIVHRFKSLTTARYRHGIVRDGWPPYRRRLWQRNYYERIVRDEAALDAIRRYIRDNPRNWRASRT